MKLTNEQLNLFQQKQCLVLTTQQEFSFNSSKQIEPTLSDVDHAANDAANHGNSFESMRQWQIDREIGIV